jgi:hypothetical protein
VGERQHRLYPLDIDKIDYIEADGNYVTIRAVELLSSCGIEPGQDPAKPRSWITWKYLRH